MLICDVEDQPTLRARMIKLARSLRWLTPDDERTELTALIRDRLAGKLTAADVDLACSLNDRHQLDSALPALATLMPPASVGEAAILACLGSAQAREQVLPAITSPRDTDFEMAQVYLRHRPLTDARELRLITAGIANLSDARVQVRALDSLAAQHLSDPQSLEELTRLYPSVQSPSVQVAIAGVLLRSDYESIATPEVVQTLRESRIRTHGAPDVVDALIRRLEAN